MAKNKSGRNKKKAKAQGNEERERERTTTTHALPRGGVEKTTAKKTSFGKTDRQDRPHTYL